MFFEGLLALGGRLEGAGKIEPALALYSALVDLGAKAPPYGTPVARGFSPAKDPQPPFFSPAKDLQPPHFNPALRAQHRLDALQGRGHFGRRAEVLIGDFANAATDYRVIAPMIAGSMVYQIAKTATFTRLATTARATWMTRGFGARATSSLVGFLFEVPTFSLASRGLMTLSGEAVPWDGASVGKDLIGATLTLGALKVSGWAGSNLVRKINKPLPSLLIPQASMFLGMLGAHKIEEAAGLRPHVDGATTVTDILSSMVSLGVGTNLGHRMLGPRFAAFQQDLAYRNQVPSHLGFPGFFEKFLAMDPAPAATPQSTLTLAMGQGVRIPGIWLSEALKENSSKPHVLSAARRGRKKTGGGKKLPQDSSKKTPPPVQEIQTTPEWRTLQKRSEINPQVLQGLAERLVAIHQKATPIFAEAGKTLTLREILRVADIVAELSLKRNLVPIGDAIRWVLGGQLAQEDLRDQLHQVLDEFEGNENLENTPLRKKVRRKLAQENANQLKAILSDFAAEDGLILEHWLTRVLKDAPFEYWMNLLPELGWNDDNLDYWVKTVPVLTSDGEIPRIFYRVLDPSEIFNKGKNARYLMTLGKKEEAHALIREIFQQPNSAEEFLDRELGWFLEQGYGDQVGSELIRRLSTKNTDFREKKELIPMVGDVAALGGPLTQKALLTLRSLIMDPDLGDMAVAALERLGDRDSIPLLKEKFANTTPMASKLEVADALIQLGESGEFIPWVQKSIEGDYYPYKLVSAEILLKAGPHPKALELLRSFDEDIVTDPEITKARRRWPQDYLNAALALGRLGEKETALAIFFRLFQLKKYESSTFLLSQIPSWPELVPLVRPLTRNPKHGVQTAALLFLDRAVPGWDRELVERGKKLINFLDEELGRKIIEEPDVGSDHLESLLREIPHWEGEGKDLSSLTPLIPRPERLILTDSTREALQSITAGILTRHPVFLQGPTGTGKNAVIRHLANLTGTPVFRINFGAETDHSALYGHFEIELAGAKAPGLQPDSVSGGSRPAEWQGQPPGTTQRRIIFKDGKMIEAMLVGGWAIWDEVNLANEGFLVAQNDVVQAIRSGTVWVKQGGKIRQIQVHPHFRLFATGNNEDTVGRKALERSFGDRWLKVAMREYTVEEQRQILREEYSGLSAETIETIPAVLHALNLAIGGEVVTIRTVKRVAARLAVGRGFSPDSARSAVPAGTVLPDRVGSKDPPYSSPNGYWEQIPDLIQAIEAEVLDGLNSEAYKIAIQALAAALPRGSLEIRDYLDREITQKEFEEKISHYTEILQAGTGGQGRGDRNRNEEDLGAEAPSYGESVAGGLQPPGTNLVPVPTTLFYAYRVLDSLIRGDYVILEGPPAVSKTAIPRWIGRLSGQEVIEATGSPDHSAAEMVGMPTINENGEIVFQKGYFVEALERGAILILNEGNLIPAEVLERLNSVYDDDKMILITENGAKRPVVAHPNFRLVITENPAGMGGSRRAHSFPLENKFRKIFLREDFKPEELSEILRVQQPSLAPAAEAMVNFHVEARELLAPNGEHLTLRDLQRWGVIAATLAPLPGLNPIQAIEMSARMAYSARFLGEEAREILAVPLENLNQGLRKDSAIHSLADSGDQGLRNTFRKKIRDYLQKEGSSDLLKLYEFLAKEHDMPLDIWLSRAVGGLNEKELNGVFHGLGFDQEEIIQFIEGFRVRSGLPLLKKVILENNELSLSAIRAIGELGDLANLPYLEKLLRDENHLVGETAANTLEEIRLRDENDPFKETVAKALVTLISFAGRQAVEQALAHEDELVRLVAAWELEFLADPAAGPALSKAFKDNKGQVVTAAFRALEALVDPTTRPELKIALRENNYFIHRAAAARSLGILGYPSDRSDLEKALKDPEPEVRSAAAEALGKLRNLNSVPALVEALKDEKSSVRSAAAAALGSLGDSTARPALEEALRDEAQNVHIAAANSLDLIAPGWDREISERGKMVFAILEEELNRTVSDAAKEESYGLLKEMLRALESPKAAPGEFQPASPLRQKVRAHLAKENTSTPHQLYQSLAAELGLPLDIWLGRVLQNATAEQVEEVSTPLFLGREMRHSRFMGTHRLHQMAPWLEARLEGGWNWEAAQALKEMGRLDSMERLKNFLQSDRIEYQKLAIRTLGEIGNEAAIQELRDFYPKAPTHSRVLIADGLRKIEGREDLPELPEILTEQDSATRFLIAYHLGEIGYRPAIPFLMNWLREESPQAIIIKAAAAHALGALGAREAIPELREGLFNYEDDSRLMNGELYQKNQTTVQEIHSRQIETNFSAVAAMALGRLGDHESIPDLRGLLSSREFHVAVGAAAGLSHLQDTQSIPQIRMLLLKKGFKPGYLFAAPVLAEALARLGDYEFIRDLRSHELATTLLPDSLFLEAWDRLQPGWDRDWIQDGPELLRVVREELERPVAEVRNTGPISRPNLVQATPPTDPELRALVPPAERLSLTHSVIENLKGLIAGILANEPVLMIGPTGTGKNAMLRYLAHLTGTALYRINFGAETDHAQLYGHFEVEVVPGAKAPGLPPDSVAGGLQPPGSPQRRIVFRDGKMIEAMRKGGWAVWDEVNLANEGFLVSQNDVVQAIKTGRVFVKQGGKVVEIEVHPNFRLFANGNPEGTVGRKALERSFGDRWLKLATQEFTVEEQRQILREEFSALSAETIETIPAVLHALNLAIGGNTITIRTVKRVAKRLADSSVGRVFRPDSARSAVPAGTVLTDRVGSKDPPYGLSELIHAIDAEILDGLPPEAYQNAVEALAAALPRGNQEIAPYLEPESAEQERKGFFEKIEEYRKAVDGGAKAPSYGSGTNLVPVPTTIHYALKVLDSLRRGDYVIIEGPPAVSKSAIPKWIGKLSGQKVIDATGSPDHSVAEMVGMPTINEDGEIVFQKGYFVEALEEGAILLLNEGNLIPAEVLERLNSVYDDDKMILITENGAKRPVKAHPNFRLVITQNPAGMSGGRRAHSGPLENKFRKIFVRKDFQAEELVEILSEQHPQLAATAPAMVRLHLQARELFQTQGETITLRDLQRWGAIAMAMGPLPGMNPVQAIELGARIGYPGRFLDEEARETMDLPLEALSRELKESSAAVPLDPKDPLTIRVMEFLSREKNDLGGLYVQEAKVLAQEHKLPLDYCLARLLKDASPEILEAAFAQWPIHSMNPFFKEEAWADWAGHYQVAGAAPALFRLLRDPAYSNFEKMNVIQALGELKVQESIPDLVKILRDPMTEGSILLQKPLVWALRQMGSKEVMIEELKFHTDKADLDPGLIRFILHHLVGLDAQEALPLLEDLRLLKPWEKLYDGHQTSLKYEVIRTIEDLQRPKTNVSKEQKIENLKRDLAGPKTGTRAVDTAIAAVELVRLGVSGIEEEIRKLLSKRNPPLVRILGAQAIGLLGHRKEAASHLHQLLKRVEKPQMRAIILEALEEMKWADPLEAHGKNLSRTLEAVLQSQVKELEGIDSETVARLLNQLPTWGNNRKEHLREKIRGYLAKERVTNFQGIYESLASEQGMALDLWLARASQELPVEDFEIILSNLTWEKINIIDWIVNYKIRAGIPYLIRSLKDPDNYARIDAVEALEKLGDPAARPALEAAVKDPDIVVRHIALAALGILGDASAPPALKAALKDPDRVVRLTAAEALEKLGDLSARPALEEALKDPSYEVRMAAVEALGSLGDPAALTALKAALKDSSYEVRMKAAEALGSLGDPAARPSLKAARKDPVDAVRISAVEALGRLGDPAARPALEAAVKDLDFDLDVRLKAAEALGRLRDPAARSSLEAALKDPAYEVRMKAAEALGELGDPAARPALEAALKDADNSVRWAAAEGLDRIAPGWDAESIAEARETLRILHEEMGRSVSQTWQEASADYAKLESQLPAWAKAPSDEQAIASHIPKEESLVKVPSTQEALKGLVAGILANEPVLMIGPTGTGKNAMLRHLANLTGTPLYRINFGAETDHAQLYGHFEIEVVPGAKAPGLPPEYGKHPESREPVAGGSRHAEWQGQPPGTPERRIVLRDGKMVEAMLSGGWVVWDEVNLANEGFLVSQNDVVQAIKSGKVFVKQGGKVVEIEVHPHFRLFATGNPETEAGRKALERSFGDRWLKVAVREYTVEEQRQILREEFGEKFSAESIESIPAVLHALKVAIGGDTITIRTVKRVARRIAEGEGGTLWEDSVGRGFSPDTGPQVPPSSGVGPKGPPYERVLNPSGMEVFIRAIDAEVLDGLTPEAYQNAVEALAAALPRGDLEITPYLEPESAEIERREFFEKIEEYRTAVDGGAKAPSYGSGTDLVPVPTTIHYALKVLDSLMRGDYVIIEGPPAVSKSAIPEWIGKLSGQKVIHATGSPDHSAAEMVGMPTINEDGEIVFQKGYFVEALETGAILILNEGNLIPAEILERLNSVYDDDKMVLITENGAKRPVKAHRNFRLVITENPPELQGGRRKHSSPLENKFRKIYIRKGFQAEELAAIVAEQMARSLGIMLPPPPPPSPSPAPSATPAAKAKTPAAKTRAAKPTSAPKAPKASPSGKKLSALPGPRLNSVFRPRKGKAGEEPRPLSPKELAEAKAQAEAATAEVQKIIEDFMATHGQTLANLGSLAAHRRIHVEVDTSEEVDIASMDMESGRMYVNPVAARDFTPQKIAAIALHEGGHAAIDRLGDKFFFEKPSRHLLANAILDPRVNEYELKRLPGARIDFTALYDDFFPDPAKLGQPEEGETLAPLGYFPHEQFAYGFIDLWANGRVTERVTHSEVRAALEKLTPEARAIWATLPDLYHPRERDVIAKSNDIYARIKREILPVYESFYQESTAMVEDALKKMRGKMPPGAGGSPTGGGGGSSSFDREDLSEEARKLLEERAGQMADKLEPRGLPPTRREQIEKARRRAEAGNQGAAYRQSDFRPYDQKTFRDLLAERAKRKQDREAFYEDHPHRKYFDPVAVPAKEVAEALKRILKIDSDFIWRGHYTSGTKLDVRKAIDAIIRNIGGIFTEEDLKLFLRKRLPTRSRRRFILVLDESGSMKGKNQPYALRLMALFNYVMEQLKTEHAAVGFSDTADIHKDFSEKFASEKERDAFMNTLETSGGGGTNDLEGLKVANDLSGPGKKLVIGIGVGEGMKAVAEVYPHHYQSSDFLGLAKTLLGILTKAMLDPNAPEDIVIVVTDGEGVAETREYVRRMESGGDIPE